MLSCGVRFSLRIATDLPTPEVVRVACDYLSATFPEATARGAYPSFSFRGQKTYDKYTVLEVAFSLSSTEDTFRQEALSACEDIARGIAEAGGWDCSVLHMKYN